MNINHELNRYDYAEGIEFNGLMAEVIKAEGVKTIGGSENSVKHFGFDAKGNDELEVVDVESFFETEETTNETPNPEPAPES